MTKDDALRIVEVIRRLAAEHEHPRAHATEEGLRERFIRFVAERPDELGEMARVVLSTGKIRFGRWYE